MQTIKFLIADLQVHECQYPQHTPDTCSRRSSSLILEQQQQKTAVSPPEL